MNKRPPDPDHPSFEPAIDQPGLPRVLLIGDSLSMGYTLPVRKRLADIATVHRPRTNCRSTRQSLEELGDYLGDSPWDLIHFNWGIHDITLMDENRKAHDQGTSQVSIDQYEENLRTLVAKLKAAASKLIWASSTPVQPDTLFRRDADVQAYNAVAAQVMAENDIATNDLYAVLAPRLTELQPPQNVHCNHAGYETLANAVAAEIQRALIASKSDMGL